MNWLGSLDGWQVCGFAVGIALLIAGLVFLSTRVGHEQNRQRQQLSKLALQSNKRNPMQGQPNCPLLLGHQCDFLASEAGQELKTMKTGQSQTDELRDYQGTK